MGLGGSRCIWLKGQLRKMLRSAVQSGGIDGEIFHIPHLLVRRVSAIEPWKTRESGRWPFRRSHSLRPRHLTRPVRRSKGGQRSDRG